MSTIVSIQSFVVAHMALGSVGEDAVSDAVPSATVAPGHKGGIVRITQ